VAAGLLDFMCRWNVFEWLLPMNRIKMLQGWIKKQAAFRYKIVDGELILRQKGIGCNAYEFSEDVIIELYLNTP
jgi:hypothetical protein